MKLRERVMQWEQQDQIITPEQRAEIIQRAERIREIAKPKELPGLVVKNSIAMFECYIYEPIQKNDRKVWTTFKEFVRAIEQVSTEREIEYEYDELKRVRKNIARLRTERDNYENAGHFQDASKIIGAIQSNYEHMRKILKIQD